MVEPEPEVWVRVQQTQFVGQASCTNKQKDLMDQIVLEPEPKTFKMVEPEPEFLVPVPQSTALAESSLRCHAALQ